MQDKPIDIEPAGQDELDELDYLAQVAHREAQVDEEHEGSLCSGCGCYLSSLDIALSGHECEDCAWDGGIVPKEDYDEEGNPQELNFDD